jgi:ribosomal protein S27AE
MDSINKIINQKDFNFNIKELSEKIVNEMDKNDTKVVKSIKVKCEKCGKFMTEHTKRFTHDAKCKGAPPEKRKVKRRVKVESIQNDGDQVSIDLKQYVRDPTINNAEPKPRRPPRVNSKKEVYDRLYNQAVK